MLRNAALLALGGVSDKDVAVDSLEEFQEATSAESGSVQDPEERRALIAALLASG